MFKTILMWSLWRTWLTFWSHFSITTSKDIFKKTESFSLTIVFIVCATLTFINIVCSTNIFCNSFLKMTTLTPSRIIFFCQKYKCQFFKGQHQTQKHHDTTIQRHNNAARQYNRRAWSKHHIEWNTTEKTNTFYINIK